MIEQLLKRIAKTLDDEEIPYMIIGGQAVLIHGRPRLTEDVDITLGVDTDRIDQLLAICRLLKLKPLPKNPKEFSTETKVLPAHDPDTQLRVDFLFSNTPYEKQAIERTEKVPMAGYFVRFASAEDLLIHKLFAGRAIDLEDAKTVLLRKGKGLDRVYIRKWLRSLSEVAEGSEDLVSVWQRLCKETE